MTTQNIRSYNTIALLPQQGITTADEGGHGYIEHFSKCTMYRGTWDINCTDTANLRTVLVGAHS